MLHILNLLRTHKHLNAQRLAEECNVTERSIYRDIISLSEMNVPIYYDNGYKLASDNFLPSLNFSFDEYHLLKLALESSPLIKTDKYHQIYKSLIAKIENCLSEQVRKTKKITPETTHIEQSLPDSNTDSVHYYHTLENAVTTCQSIKLTYESINSGISDRIVDPYFIIYRNQAFYFVGYCHTRKDFRTFRINRIKKIQVLDDIFYKQDNIRPETYFEGSWSIYSGEPVTVEVIFSGVSARVIATTTHHPDEQLTHLADDRIKYTVTTRGYEEISRWLLGFGDGVEVIAPKELRKKLFQLGNYFQTKYK